MRTRIKAIKQNTKHDSKNVLSKDCGQYLKSFCFGEDPGFKLSLKLMQDIEDRELKSKIRFAIGLPSIDVLRTCNVYEYVNRGVLMHFIKMGGNFYSLTRNNVLEGYLSASYMKEMIVSRYKLMSN